MQRFFVGLDVGSTTVKAIVVDAATDKTIWQDYQRHDRVGGGITPAVLPHHRTDRSVSGGSCLLGRT
jgi:hypothetical protein